MLFGGPPPSGHLRVHPPCGSRTIGQEPPRSVRLQCDTIIIHVETDFEIGFVNRGRKSKPYRRTPAVLLNKVEIGIQYQTRNEEYYRILSVLEIKIKLYGFKLCVLHDEYIINSRYSHRIDAIQLNATRRQVIKNYRCLTRINTA